MAIEGTRVSGASKTTLQIAQFASSARITMEIANGIHTLFQLPSY
jgi:hypothetical protein